MAYLLIVDDDVDGREALCAALVKVGHEVICVSDGSPSWSVRLTWSSWTY